MNPPATENQIAIFRCGANVAIPTNNAARFVWTVKRGNNMVDELRIEKRENVPSKSTCITTVYSEFEYNVTLLDRSNTTITCTAYSESLSRSFAIPGKNKQILFLLHCLFYFFFLQVQAAPTLSLCMCAYISVIPYFSLCGFILLPVYMHVCVCVFANVSAVIFLHV